MLVLLIEIELLNVVVDIYIEVNFNTRLCIRTKMTDEYYFLCKFSIIKKRTNFFILQISINTKTNNIFFYSQSLFRWIMLYIVFRIAEINLELGLL